MIARPPSAELRENQTDQDSLPPYEVLDPILEAYVERQLSIPEIVALGRGNRRRGCEVHLVPAERRYACEDVAPTDSVLTKRVGLGVAGGCFLHRRHRFPPTLQQSLEPRVGVAAQHPSSGITGLVTVILLIPA